MFARKRGKGLKTGPAVHDDLIGRVFTADAPNELWFTDIERHEALLNRAVVKGHCRRAVAAAWPKLGAA